MDTIQLKAYGKINLGLDVLGKRPDGYHEVRMIMQTVGIHDKLLIKKEAEPGIRLTTNLPYLPVNENNLVVKGAKLLQEAFHIQSGLSIRLHKYIPISAGMAGGSTDGAAVLVGMNRMFRLGLHQQELMDWGLKLGADVPFCIMRGTALSEGIGEKLQTLPPPPPAYIVIGKPPISVSTKYVYGNLKLDTVAHPDIDTIIDGLRKGNLREIAEHMGNVLETVSIPAHPVIQEIKKLLLQQGALGAMMSGSGPTVFGIFDRKDTAERAWDKLKKSRLVGQCYITTWFGSK